MLGNVIPRVLGWMPTSLRRAVIGRPNRPSQLANIAHSLLNRIAPKDSQVFTCKGALDGFRMSVDWSRYRSFVYGTWEPQVVTVVTDTVKPGMTVIDVGAHIGYYSLLFAKCVGPSGRVFAFEPVPGNFSLLKKNVELNSLLNVVTINKAVFSRTQEIKMSVPGDQSNPECASIKSAPGAPNYCVEAISIDDFCAEHSLQPDVLKIDVEGSEYDVLLGASATVNRLFPKLLIELHHFDGNLAAVPVPALLGQWGYQIQWIERWEWTSFILATSSATGIFEVPQSGSPRLASA